MKTMTAAQMTWNLKKGFAWFELDANGEAADDWRMPIWTRAGGWLWNNGPEQRYELLIV
jgi:hypothetical protein